ncbi:hypothetical protein CR513_07339, partial [Mucuna pruriens]
MSDGSSFEWESDFALELTFGMKLASKMESTSRLKVNMRISSWHGVGSTRVDILTADVRVDIMESTSSSQDTSDFYWDDFILTGTKSSWRVSSWPRQLPHQIDFVRVQVGLEHGVGPAKLALQDSACEISIQLLMIELALWSWLRLAGMLSSSSGLTWSRLHPAGTHSASTRMTSSTRDRVGLENGEVESERFQKDSTSSESESSSVETPYEGYLLMLSERGKVIVDEQLSLAITLGKYKDEIIGYKILSLILSKFDNVVPMDATHILLGRPW